MMKINSTAELSLEYINDLIADNIVFEITIQDPKNYPQGKTYDIFNILSIKRQMVEFLKDCPHKDANNPNSEKEIFAYIYTSVKLILIHTNPLIHVFTVFCVRIYL